MVAVVSSLKAVTLLVIVVVPLAAAFHAMESSWRLAKGPLPVTSKLLIVNLPGVPALTTVTKPLAPAVTPEVPTV